MPEYSATVEAWLRGASLRVHWLVFLNFANGVLRFHDGAGTLVADSQTWTGGKLSAISDIEGAHGHSAATGSVTISGLDDATIVAAVGASTNVKGRAITISLQFVDENLQPYDPPDVLVVALMDRAKIKGSVGERTVEITYEVLWARRAIPPYGNLSDRDQQKLYAGDKGLEFMPTVKSKTVKLTPV